RIRHGDGTEGWPEEAPFDAIVVAAGSPSDIPPPLLEQLAIGGRLVIPAGGEEQQRLWRITRAAEADYTREDLGPVRFVPLIGRAGWLDRDAGPSAARAAPGRRSKRKPLPARVAEACDPFDDLREASLDG